jgi:hypothetical protein
LPERNPPVTNVNMPSSYRIGALDVHDWAALTSHA